MAKRTKAEVHYRLASASTRRCHVCEHIELHGEAPATCELVQGPVERDYVCDLFEAKNDREPDNDSDDR